MRDKTGIKDTHAIKFLAWAMLACVLLGACTAVSTPQTPTMAPTATLQPSATSTVPPTHLQAQTPTVQLENPMVFSSQALGIQSVAPERWIGDTLGTFLRGGSDSDFTQLIFDYYPQMSLDWVIESLLLPQLGIEQFPESSGQVETQDMIWELYDIDLDVPDVGKVAVDLAITDTDQGPYLIALLSEPDDSVIFQQTVFLPAIEAHEVFSFDKRDEITAKSLQDPDFQPDGPVNNVYFTPMGESSKAHVELEGKLTVPEFEMQALVPRGTNNASSMSLFPAFSAEFFTYESYLVPVSRDILLSTTGESFWRIILSPGKVWSEERDGGLSRAAFPFVLVAEDTSEAHNGVATFVYGEDFVSSLRLQIIQETAAWRQVDYWGQTPMEYLPQEIGDEYIAQFTEELRSQTLIRPWSELENKHNGQVLNIYPENLDPTMVSVIGLIVEDEIFLQPCLTRYGEFPFCREMRHGVFSVTKSMGAAVAMLRLAEKYGEEVFDLRIRDYVDVSAEHDGWEEVTFGDALNMATGVGDSRDPGRFTADEDQDKFYRFMEAKSAQDKLEVSFTYGDYPWGPGEVARYNSMNTFVLSVAMQNFLKSREGPDADIWDMVIEEVYQPIGLYHAPIMRTIEPDGSRGVPIFGYGLYPTVDDVAKVAKLYQNGGMHEDQQLLHTDRLAEALYKTENLGLPTGAKYEFGDEMYNMSFWSWPYQSEAGYFFQVPYMTGFGGNHVVLMPNGMIGFRFSDGHVYGVQNLVKVADFLDPFQPP
jgi:CubicO group peptidase (beta-lactamase class C family)